MVSSHKGKIQSNRSEWMVSVLTCKELGGDHSHLLNNLKIQRCFQSEGFDITWQTSAPQMRDK